MQENEKIKSVRVALAALSVRLMEEGDTIASANASSAGGLVCTLGIINSTLEEIRDELRAGNGNGREGK